MEAKRNYQLDMEKVLAGLTKRPRLLLHVCCAPCSTAVLERLAPYFDITAYYDNPNIDTGEEYERRKREEERFAEAAGFARVEAAPYEPEAFYLAARGLEKEKEGGARCEKCFILRLSRAARYAAQNGYDFFTTSLTISPLKNAALLNRIGEEAGQKHGVRFLPSDFKKKNGYRRSVELSKQFGLYRQDYCGCVYSKMERERQKKERQREAE